MIIDEENYLAHYGVLRRSGRYPWGSGDKKTDLDVAKSFIDVVGQHRSEGLSPAEIAKIYSTPEHKLTSTDIITLKSVAKNRIKQDQIRQAVRLKEDKGYSNVQIGKIMGGMNESSVRALLDASTKDKADVLQGTADMLRKQVAEKGYIDIGGGVHHELGITEDKLKTAVALLREEGYKKHYIRLPQLTTSNETSFKILGAPDSKQPKIDQVHSIAAMNTKDGGKNWFGIQPPISISSKRVQVRHAEDGGGTADGVIYVRPGVKDLSIGPNQYGQVRILVDGTHYIKGMAIKKDGLPEGVDLVFNTNKANTGNKLDALKPIKDEEDNPFGSIVHQIIDPKTNKVTSAMNIVGQKPGAGVEGGWGDWSRSLSSQVLSKQKPELAKAQLHMTYERKRNELDEILALTNPTVKKKLLDSFADDSDSSAVHLKAAALPKQATHVILPVNTMKKDEIYAPNYNNGDRVALIRYPHGGTFEIPELTVNNRHLPAIKLLGKNAQDAVGIHHSVAERLSGADFDGDTVLVIPNHDKKIQTQPALEGLKGFDAKARYTIPKDDLKTKRMSKSNTQLEMGKITNLISDMTIKGASTDELARAIKHSMVVIDAEKHGLDYKASAVDNGIDALKRNYQGVGEKGNVKGASTLITRAKSKVYVPERKLRKASDGGPIDRATGKLVFVKTNAASGHKKITNPDGTVSWVPSGKLKQEVSTKLAETHDAHTLLSDHGGTLIERIYADHSNKLKGLANEARKATFDVAPLPKATAATKATYKAETESLKSKLIVAERNAPRERNAQRVASVEYNLRRKANPNLDASELRKMRNQLIAEARVRVGAEKDRIAITDREWEAIQSGAVSASRTADILKHADVDKVKELATPRARKVMPPSAIARAKGMLEQGYTQADVAASIGVSVATLKNHVDL